MCGIVAATSHRDVSRDLLEMLRRLDYRGYDSAGISVYDSAGKFEWRKIHGKLDRLERMFASAPISGFSGIGHTRWATHGAPNDQNAHPHFSNTGRVSVVHNGIVENYRELYKELEGWGVTPTSETDSEVIVHLIEVFLKQSPHASSFDIVKYLASKLRGAFATGIQILDRPEEIIGLRYQCPLNFIQLDGFAAISSDISSLVKYTDHIGVLRDGRAVVLRPESIEVLDFEGQRSQAIYVTVDWSVEQATKGGHPYFLRKEIEEEPDAIRSLIKSVRSVESDLRRYIQSRDVRRVQFLACGSASYSGVFASTLSRHWQLPIDVASDIGSEFRYKPARLDKSTLVVAISQSGETADTLGAVGHAVEASAGVISFVNVVGSSLDRSSDLSVRLAAGPEIAVPSSKAVVNQFLATTLIACLLRENSKASVDLWQTHSEAVANAITQIISLEADWQAAGARFSGHQSCFALGRGLDYPIALEMALKLKETAYIHGEAMYAGEFKHGSISLIEHGMPIFCFMGDHSVRQKTISNIEEVKARGAQPIIVDPSPEGVSSLEHLGLYYRIPYLQEPWSSISQLSVTHFLAYHAGLIRNVDVDRPRNLAKSVTVE